ncbi:bifunctional 2-polyprenyl-6-hydroxyphenol methylase/3-demethylubiquinol 3-O-methyltransferase UbiG [Streptomyces sp. McG3]|uniref:class I SAM-dependent methyltransferase n=1 Tax=unclassified Streptomyces TaxID=2593676 RepID=UPI001BE569BA|nr:class I SAM-dependent methyltransferase [Streptomyces sp. McG3]MBT2901324.1 class I SAM-dependent methyltransferase [Streptomyces sp. McG3]
MPARHDIAAETELWDSYAASAFKDGMEPAFCWTQYAGHGPGPELLGDPASVLEIGCGTGRALALLAGLGIKARGIDLSPVMVKKVTERWAGTGADFVCSEVLETLAVDEATYDAVYSIFGAVWFTDPARLLPLVASRLRPGGVFAFSHPPAIPGAYGPQGMYKGGFTGKAMYTYRYSYTPRRWAGLLERAGFRAIDARVLDAPQAGHIGTLLVTARR